MFKRENVPPSRPPLKLPHPPSVDEIGQIFSESMRQVETRLYLSWPNSDRSGEFLLGVFYPNTSQDAYWEFFDGSDRQKAPLWAYVTSDILLVYNLIGSSMESVEQKAGTKKPKKNADYGELYMLPSAYYSTALDLMAQAQKRQGVAAAPANQQAGQLESLLNGDLARVDLSHLMQSINHARLTGRLRLQTPGGHGGVWFDQGLPVCAVIGNTIGDEAFLQLFIQTQGEFKYEDSVHPEKQNIRQALEPLLLKGVLLRDKMRFLNNAGLTPDSILVRKQKDLAEAEFEKISAAAASGSYLTFSMMAQKEFYMAIDDRSNIRQLADKLRLTHSQWIPLLCRMLKCDFVALTEQPKESVQQLQPKALDRNAIHSVMLSLRRPETGLFTYPAFNYFLDQEYIKARRSNNPLTLIIIDARISGGNYEYRSPLPAAALIELLRRISTIKRDADLVGHYEVFDVGIILPDTNAAGALSFIQRLAQVLNEPPLSSQPDTLVSIVIGCATAPDHVHDLEMLVAAAESAKNTAQHNPSGIAAYSPGAVGAR